LNLANCEITDIGAANVASLLSDLQLGLKTLILHWNKIRGPGSSKIAKALKINNSLRILDVSYNSFGASKLL
jgi:hypothetical protein